MSAIIYNAWVNKERRDIWINELKKKFEKETIRCHCGYYFHEDDIIFDSDEHLTLSETKYWVYLECPRCHYGLAAWKAKNRFDRMAVPKKYSNKVRDKNGNYLIVKSNKCLRCGRDLSDPRSMARGLGPVCAKKQ